MPSSQNTFGKDTLINLGVLIVGLGSIYLALKVWGPEEMRAFIESAGVWAPLALIAAKTSTIVFAPLSGALLYPLAGTLFGFWKGIVLVFIGDAIGGSIAFWISRRFGRTFAERFLGSDSGLLGHILDTMSTVRGFFWTRLLLITTQDILAYAAGLTRLPYVPFIIIHSVIGLVPAAIMTWLGDALLANPSAGGVGLVFLGSSVVGMISILGFMWFNRRRIFEKVESN